MPYMGYKGDNSAARPPEGSLVETRCLKRPQVCHCSFCRATLRTEVQNRPRGVPSHLNIPEKDRADSEAKKKKKKALKDSIAPTKIPYTNYESVVNKSIFKKCQDHWDTHTNNKLHSIKSNIGEWNINYKNRREQVVVTRLHIGHTYITHHQLLKGSESLICSTRRKKQQKH